MYKSTNKKKKTFFVKYLVFFFFFFKATEYSTESKEISVQKQATEYLSSTVKPAAQFHISKANEH